MFIIIITLIQLILTQNINDYIFSPFPVKEHQISQYQAASTRVKIGKNSNLVFVSCGYGGIMIIDQTTNQLIYNQPSSEFLHSLEVTSDGQYIYMSYQQKFSVFKFNKEQIALNFITSIDFYPQSTITDIVLEKKEEIIFVVGLNGAVMCYYVGIKSEIKYLAQFNTKSNIIHMVTVSEDGQWIFLGDDLNGLMVLKLLQIEQFQFTFVKAAQGFTKWKTWAVKITKDKKYAYCLDNWNGIFIANLSFLYSLNEENFPQQIIFNERFWPFLEINPSVYSLWINQKENLLLVGVRSQGIFIFDIQNKDEQPIFVYQIQVEAHAFDITMSSSEDKIYFVNAKSVYIFQKSIPNLNQNFPNLFNTHQVNITSFSDSFYKWRCYVDAQTRFFFGAFDDKGLFVLSIENKDINKMKIIQNIKFEPATLVDSLIFYEEENLLYVPVQENNSVIYTFDVSNMNEPIIIDKLWVESPQHAEHIVFSKDKNYIVISFDDSVLYVNARNKKKLETLCRWIKQPEMTGENAGAFSTNNNQFIIGTVRNYGIYILDVEIPQKPVLVNQMQTLGAEGIIRSFKNDNVAYLYDGFKGIIILDLSKLPEIQIFSRINTSGWANLVTSILNEDFLIISTMESGMISLVDIREIKQPKIISKFQIGKQSSQSHCLTQELTYMLINNDLGTAILPIKNNILLHTEIRILQKEGNSTSISGEDRILIGQQAEFSFMVIYPEEGVQIQNIFYYQNYEIKAIPFWMTFNRISKSLLLNVVKDALGNSENKENLNTILVQISVPIQESAFIDEDLKINIDTSLEIHQILKEKGIISPQNYLDSLDSLTAQTIQNIANEKILDQIRFFELIKIKLQKSKSMNPVLFEVKASLQFNTSNTSQYISSISEKLNVYLTIDKEIGKFVLINYPNVIISATDSQDQLKLEGNLVSINKVFEQKITYSLKDKNFNGNNEIEILIQDNINFDIKQKYLINECNFIKLNFEVVLNQTKTLQSQINKVFSKSIVPIETDLVIEFEKNTFIDKDTPKLFYSAFVLQGNQFQVLQTDFWLQFDADQLKFRGKAPANYLYEKFTFKVLASDGYSEAFDTFILRVESLPFIFILDYLIKIFGPIIGFFGIIKYKAIFLNILLFKRVMYSQEIININKMYLKKINLIGDEAERAYSIFQSFLSNNKDKMGKYTEPLIHTMLENTSIQSTQKEKKIIKKLHKIDDEDEDYALKNTIEILKTQKQIQKKSIFILQYINLDGTVNIQKVVSDIQRQQTEYKYKGRTFTAKNHTQDFQNKHNKFNLCLRAQIAQFFIENDVRTYAVYKYLKHFSLKNFQYTQNDWYKMYVEIIATEELDKTGLPVPFPQVNIKDKALDLALNKVCFYYQKIEKIEKIDKSDQNKKSFLNINFQLLKIVLIADTFGILRQSAPTFRPSVGESIHLHSHQIASVEAFKQIKNSHCMFLRKLLYFDYVHYGTSKNINLPNWIAFDQKNGIITLQGMPESQDVDEILIRIFDDEEQCIRQFILKIVNEFQEDDYEKSFQERQEENFVENIGEECQSSHNNVIQQFSGVFKGNLNKQLGIYQFFKNLTYVYGNNNLNT
ncbi:hypothetical protein IMG5_078340 [Ichthyophthirius multifiliis]|uniref:Calpain family cysteine protease n=1 Tax=Ichthyophthirius multifiliis TaxID=5932 RepID=G0QQG1_ICHMU|nr:hypothetical protein IMG5_078340 [Ichthyophthirius multifiliis]EGR32546.1 hypothetical protein IMG5_078340 [Ichthyophthirius multifiliis]|eukprot:XP_004036532.1 hypothetical protein IMG5_078340 [Ichthyophthirius multifiliis]